MATIELNPSGSQDDRFAVTANTVKIRVTGGTDFTNYESDDSIRYSNIKQTYKFNYYTGSDLRSRQYVVNGKTNNNGIITITLYGLEQGKENEITVDIDYEYYVSEYIVDITFGPNGIVDNSYWSTPELKTNSIKNEGELTVYTQNTKNFNVFWKNNTDNEVISTGKYIYKHITRTNVNQWIEQLGIWSSWYHQKDYYSTGTTTKTVRVPNINTASTSDTISLTTPSINSNITAAWYRNCGNACGLSSMNNIKGLGDSGVQAKDATYITAQHFINLAKAVTTWNK